MKRSSFIISLLLGIFLSGLAVVILVHDAEYIFTGKTVNLNEVIENGGEMPRDKYVTYTCNYPLGNYAETKQTISGVIPLPFKTQQYALLCENGIIMSAEVSKKAKIEELNEAIDDMYNGEAASVTLTGCLITNNPEMNGYLSEFLTAVGIDTESSDIQQTYYLIDTTKTRLSLILAYTFLLVIGLFVIIVDIKKYRGASF